LAQKRQLQRLKNNSDGRETTNTDGSPKVLVYEGAHRLGVVLCYVVVGAMCILGRASSGKDLWTTKKMGRWDGWVQHTYTSCPILTTLCAVLCSDFATRLVVERQMDRQRA